MSEVNASVPSEEWKNAIQSYMIYLSDLTYRIDMGEYHLIREYKAKLNVGISNLEGWFKLDEETKIKELQEQTLIIKGISEQVNPFIGTVSFGINYEFSEYLSKLKQVEKILRVVAKRENFLVKVSEKNVRLT
jgi:hypothetical protein